MRAIFIHCGMQQGVKHTIKTNGAYYMTMTVVDWADVFTRSAVVVLLRKSGRSQYRAFI